MYPKDKAAPNSASLCAHEMVSYWIIFRQDSVTRCFEYNGQ